MNPYKTCAEWRPSAMDPPLSAHLPEDRADWVVVNVSDKDLKDQKGTEVHKFGHWMSGAFYVRIKPPPRGEWR